MLQAIVCKWDQDVINPKSYDSQYAAQLYQNWAYFCDPATKKLSVRLEGLLLGALWENPMMASLGLLRGLKWSVLLS